MPEKTVRPASNHQMAALGLDAERGREERVRDHRRCLQNQRRHKHHDRGNLPRGRDAVRLMEAPDIEGRKDHGHQKQKPAGGRRSGIDVSARRVGPLPGELGVNRNHRKQEKGRKHRDIIETIKKLGAGYPIHRFDDFRMKWEGIACALPREGRVGK